MIKVVIDPGHGGTADFGGSSWNNARGPNGTLEKDLTLDVGQAAFRALESDGIEVIITRNSDVNVGIVDRAKVAKNIKAAAFVSIHFNGADPKKPPAQGTETWVEKLATDKSKHLAREVQRSVQDATGYRDRGVKLGNVSGVIRNKYHSKTTAHCLVEVSFIDRQPDDEERLQDADYIDELGEAVANGLRQYLRDVGLLYDLTVSASASAENEPEDAASAARMGLLDSDGEFEGQFEASSHRSESFLVNSGSSVQLAAANLLSTDIGSRFQMAQKIVDFEARRDSKGRLAVYQLPKGDGGGSYEVAGINERYHKEVCDQLVELIEGGEHDKAERLAVEFVASYTDVVITWCQVAAVESFLRDCAFNRGPSGAAWIVQDAVDVERDRVVGQITREAIGKAQEKPRKLLKMLRASREIFEREVVGRDEKSKFWKGLANRWNNALEFALKFLEPESEFTKRAYPFNVTSLVTDAKFIPRSNLSNARSDQIVLRELAKPHDLEFPVQQMIELRNYSYPDSRPRYWGIVDFELHSSEPRLFVLDVVDEEIRSYLCAHGIGSEGSLDDGFAEVFSNEPGSKMTSLGIYRCSETYDSSKNGYSMRLDGLVDENSNARSRYIVMHGADYVSEEFVKTYKRIGRSDGCPAIARSETKKVVDQLKFGSFLNHWKVP